MKINRHRSKPFFTRYAPSMIKCIAGSNRYGKRIGTIDNDNATEVCPVCGDNEYWEPFALCTNNKDNRK